jgi:hypothetical protein
LFLKGIQVIRRLNGREVTTEHLLQVISEMNERATKKMLVALRNETRVDEAKDPADVWNHKIYCQDRRTSLDAPGVKVPLIYTPLVTTEIITFTIDELDELLDFCASCLDVEAVTPKEPAMKKAKNSIMYTSNWQPNPRFTEGRMRLEEVVSRVRSRSLPSASGSASSKGA